MGFLIFTWVVALLSIVGVLLNIKKISYCFFIWAFTNFSWMAVDFYMGLYPQAVLFGVYFILALWGIYEWVYKRDKDNIKNKAIKSGKVEGVEYRYFIDKEEVTEDFARANVYPYFEICIGSDGVLRHVFKKHNGQILLFEDWTKEDMNKVVAFLNKGLTFKG